MLAPSCPLLYVPLDVELETDLDPEIRGWLAFAVQKLDELATLGRALADGRDETIAELEESSCIVEARKSSPLIHSSAVGVRLAAVTPDLARRPSRYSSGRRRRHRSSCQRCPPPRSAPCRKQQRSVRRAPATRAVS
jgi:5-methyltetrahydropteroyltriglutamate--homocysteine methyltransferase